MKTSLTIDAIINEFKSEIDAQPQTVFVYMEILKLFYRWADRNTLDKRNIKFNELIKYKQDMLNHKKSSMYINLHVFTLRKYFNWLNNKGYYSNMAKDLKRMKVKSDLRTQPLSEDELITLLSSVDKSNVIGLRDYIILSLLVLTGCRVVEIYRMNIGDMYKQNDKIIWKIVQKGYTDQSGSKDITILFPFILKYLGNRIENKCDPVFINQKLIRKKIQRLSRWSIQFMINSYYKRVGLKNKLIKPHSIRHSFALMQLENGASPFEVQSMLGHSSFASTEKYMEYAKRKQNIEDKASQLMIKKIFINT